MIIEQMQLFARGEHHNDAGFIVDITNSVVYKQFDNASKIMQNYRINNVYGIKEQNLCGVKIVKVYETLLQKLRQKTGEMSYVCIISFCLL